VLGPRRGCGRGAPCFEAGEVEQIREDHLYACGPIGSLQSQAVGASLKRAIDARAGAAPEDARLKEHPRPVCGCQHRFARTRKIDGRLAGLQQRMRRDRWRRAASAWNILNQARGVDRHGAVDKTEDLDQRRLRQGQALAHLNRARSGRREFGIGTRGFGARPKLIVGECPSPSGERLSSSHVRVSGRNGLFGGDDVEERDAHGVLHRELRHALVGAGAGDPRLGLANRGSSQPEVERLPGEKPARRGTPDRLRPLRWKNRTGERRDH